MTRTLTDTAFLFPGQGSQRPGMGASFHEAWPETRAVLSDLTEALLPELDLQELCFEADAETLHATEHTQPALFGIGLATYRGLRERTGLKPAIVAGHSLGHFTALAASGMLDPVEGVTLVRRRGQLMAAAANKAPDGVMCAVLLADPKTVAESCADYPDVSVAAFNAPRETVISGSAASVADIREEVNQKTSARFRELETETAFHSPLMEPAREQFSTVLGDTELCSGEIPVASDISETVYTEPAMSRPELTAQLTASIDWVGTIRRLRDRGITRFVEFPPAGTLGRLIERIDSTATTITLDKPDDAETLV
ncbi:MAG: ACP S-malonyltransferase [Haloarcula sp.]